AFCAFYPIDRSNFQSAKSNFLILAHNPGKISGINGTAFPPPAGPGFILLCYFGPGRFLSLCYSIRNTKRGDGKCSNRRSGKNVNLGKFRDHYDFLCFVNSTAYTSFFPSKFALKITHFPSGEKCTSGSSR